MADVPLVDIVDGIPTSGTGTVQTTSNVTALLGALDVAKVTDPDAASATANALLRGLISIIANGVATSLPAGDNNVGNFDVVTVPTDPFGANVDGASSTGSISAKLRFIAGTGIPITGTVTVGSHAVTNAGTFAAQVTTINGVAPAFNQGSVGATVQRIAEAGFTTGTTTQVASSATNVTLKAANTARSGLSIYNSSTQILYVKLGATASATSFAVAMAASSYYEVPAKYNGIVDGIWASANGNAYVTEIA